MDHFVAKTTTAQRRKIICPKAHRKVVAEPGLWYKCPLSPVIKSSIFPPYPNPCLYTCTSMIYVHIDTHMHRILSEYIRDNLGM